MTAEQIYNRLINAGFTHAGACALLGNWQAESELQSNNAENGRGLNDSVYTAAVDQGMISRAQFVSDNVGYGLAQWTDKNRKNKLYDYAKACGVSISDAAMQVEFALLEFPTEAPDTMRLCMSSDDLKKCTEWICRYYERPAVNNVSYRYECAQKFSAELTAAEAENPQYFPPDQSVLVLQAVLVANGYPAQVTGYKSKEFIELMREFVDDMENC